MDARIEFEDREIRARLEQAVRAGENMVPLMDAIGSWLQDSAKRRIEETKTAPDGTAWEKSFREVNAGARHPDADEDAPVQRAGKTMYLSGALAKSLTHCARRDSVDIGTNLIYAAVHQFGAMITPVNATALAFFLADGRRVVTGSVTIPARPYLGISADDEEQIAEFVPIHFGMAS